jgi:hypothetical protein
MEMDFSNPIMCIIELQTEIDKMNGEIDFKKKQMMEPLVQLFNKLNNKLVKKESIYDRKYDIDTCYAYVFDITDYVITFSCYEYPTYCKISVGNNDNGELVYDIAHKNMGKYFNSEKVDCTNVNSVILAVLTYFANHAKIVNDARQETACFKVFETGDIIEICNNIWSTNSKPIEKEIDKLLKKASRKFRCKVTMREQGKMYIINASDTYVAYDVKEWLRKQFHNKKYQDRNIYYLNKNPWYNGVEK